MNAAFPFLSDTFHFIASNKWVERFKKKYRIRQRKITKYISHKEHDTIENIAEAAVKFQTQTKALMANFDLDFVINTDQTGCQYQATYNRSLEMAGTKVVAVATKNLDVVTHCYTAQYAIPASGKIIPQVFLCLREPSGYFGPRVEKTVEALTKKYKNVIVTCTKSGKFTKQIFQQFLRSVMLPYVEKNEFLLIIDSWRGQTDSALFDDIFHDDNGAVTATIKIIPPKCTPVCQPCDVYFYRQVKMFIKRLQNAPALLKENREISSREDAIKIHSILLHQLTSPKCRPMLKYAWFASKLTTEREIFLNLNELCFPISVLKKPCNCKEVGFIKCTWCDKVYCFNCFYDNYHPYECVVHDDNSDNDL